VTAVDAEFISFTSVSAYIGGTELGLTQNPWLTMLKFNLIILVPRAAEPENFIA